MNCCYKCADRDAHCHAVCQKYINARAELDARNAELNRQRQGHIAALDVTLRTVTKIRKEQGKNKWR